MGKLSDLGESMQASEASLPRKKEKWYPSMHVTSKQLPGLEEMRSGKTVKMEIEAIITNVDDPIRGPKSFSMELRKGAIINGKGKKSDKEKGENS